MTNGKFRTIEEKVLIIGTIISALVFLASVLAYLAGLESMGVEFIILSGLGILGGISSLKYYQHALDDTVVRRKDQGGE